DGSFVYVPVAGYRGPDSFTYRAYNGFADSDPVQVDITVARPNHPPIAHDDNYAIITDQVLTVVAPGVLANDFDSDGQPLTAVLDTGRTHGVLARDPTGAFTYTPDPAMSATTASPITRTTGSTTRPRRSSASPSARRIRRRWPSTIRDMSRPPACRFRFQR